MASIEVIATVASAALDFLSASRNFILKGYNLSKNGIGKWRDRNDPLYQYKRLLKKKYPYYFNKLNELPREAQILFFRIYNTFKKRYSGKDIKFIKSYNSSFDSMYFPITGLIKGLAIEEIDIIMQVLKYSKFITDYYNQDELDKMGSQYGLYFCHLKKTSHTLLKEGIILVIPSEFGARSYLLAMACEVNTPCEKFCSVTILNSENLDIATNFYTEEDIKNFSYNKY